MTVKRYTPTQCCEHDGTYVTYSDYQKLVAENAALKEFRPQPNGAAMMEALDAFFANEEYPEGAMSDAFEILCCKRVSIPNTDAAIAEIKAQGVDELAEAWEAIKPEEGVSMSESTALKYKQRAQDARDFAANLRAGRKG